MQAAAGAADGGAAKSLSRRWKPRRGRRGWQDFADVGGDATIGREGGLGDQSALIDEWTKDVKTI